LKRRYTKKSPIRVVGTVLCSHEASLASSREPAAPAPRPAEAPAAAVKTLNLEEVHFDFDQDNLRPDALAVLDRVVDGLKQNPGMRLRIEGHASAEGTAEYNLALGERRAHRVEEYLVNRGIPTAALATLSKGEESPKYDNTQEEGRALNRRAEFVIDSVPK